MFTKVSVWGFVREYGLEYAIVAMVIVLASINLYQSDYGGFMFAGGVLFGMFLMMGAEYLNQRYDFGS